MKKIQDLVEIVDEEIADAKKYAEAYLYEKASQQNPKFAKYYNEMCQDELKHATYIHEILVDEIGKLEKVYKAPEDMKEAWEKSHERYVTKVAWIKQMLAM